MDLLRHAASRWYQRNRGAGPRRKASPLSGSGGFFPRVVLRVQGNHFGPVLLVGIIPAVGNAGFPAFYRQLPG